MRIQKPVTIDLLGLMIVISLVTGLNVCSAAAPDLPAIYKQHLENQRHSAGTGMHKKFHSGDHTDTAYSYILDGDRWIFKPTSSSHFRDDGSVRPTTAEQVASDSVLFWVAKAGVSLAREGRSGAGPYLATKAPSPEVPAAGKARPR